MLLSEANALGFEDFINVFDNVIELCPIVAATVWADRPFQDINTLQTSIENFINCLPLEARAGILRCHPDLAGRMAGAGQLTDESKLEQKAAGLDDMTGEEKTKLNLLNKRYKEKFGFPFVICARENKKDAILKGIASRSNNDRNTEIATGIAEVKKICRLRLASILTAAGDAKL